jgi:hypothetical protein
MPKSDAPGLGRRPAFEVLSSWCDRLCIRFASNLCVWDLALLVLAIHGHVGFAVKWATSSWPRDALSKYDKRCCHIIEQPGLMHTTDNTTDAACPVSLHSYCIAIRIYNIPWAQNGTEWSCNCQLPFSCFRCFLLPCWGRCTWCNTDSQHYSSSCLELWLDPQTPSGLVKSSNLSTWSTWFFMFFLHFPPRLPPSHSFPIPNLEIRELSATEIPTCLIALRKATARVESDFGKQIHFPDNHGELWIGEGRCCTTT